MPNQGDSSMTDREMDKMLDEIFQRVFGDRW
jgi:hypothetical protein